MGLCENVYRRGGVYWWHRRVSPCKTKNPRHIYVQISLMVREPKRARALARIVAVEADRLEGLGVLDAATQKDLLKRFIAQRTAILDHHAQETTSTDYLRGPEGAKAALAERISLQRQMGAAYGLLARRTLRRN